jgi:hypothetical protein
MGSRSMGELWEVCITLSFSSEELKLTFVVVWERQGGGRDSEFSGHQRGRRYSFVGWPNLGISPYVPLLVVVVIT